jgi:hypothetical protein
MNNSPSSTPETRFATIVETLITHPGVTPPSNGSRFGSSALKIHDKIFAMLVRGEFVVKLPKARVDSLIASDLGTPFYPRPNASPMKEWITISPTTDLDWLSLA